MSVTKAGHPEPDRTAETSYNISPVLVLSIIEQKKFPCVSILKLSCYSLTNVVFVFMLLKEVGNATLHIFSVLFLVLELSTKHAGGSGENTKKIDVEDKNHSRGTNHAKNYHQHLFMVLLRFPWSQ